VLLDCKSLVEALKNPCSTDVEIKTIQLATADLRRKDKSFLSPGNVPGNDLAKAKEGSLAEQPPTTPDEDTNKDRLFHPRSHAQGEERKYPDTHSPANYKTYKDRTQTANPMIVGGVCGSSCGEDM